MNLKESQCVQYGCGWSAPDGWLNFDSSPTLYFERIPLIGRFYTKNKLRFPKNVQYGDIVKGLPLQNGSCQAVYCSHVLEHLTLQEFRQALFHTYEMLQDGGWFRLVLPDLEFYAKKYLNDSSTESSLLFMTETGLGQTNRGRNLAGFLVQWLGNSQHRWMWDFNSMQRELEDVGFVEIRRAEFGDSRLAKFEDVEEKDRWENCLGVECRK